MSRPFPPARALVFLPLLFLGACSVFGSPIQNRGNRVDSDVLGELVVGTSTKADVTALIGSPTTRATFDDDTWIYIGLQTRQRIGRTLGVESMDNTVLTFNEQGVLSTVQRLNDGDSLPVQVVSRTTPSPGSEASFLQQLLGNVGRYNPVGSKGGSGGGAGTSGSGVPGATGPGQGL